jgi:methionyl-tRNA formyltransferase
MRTVLVGNRALAKHVLRRMLETDWTVVGAVTPPADSSMALGQAGFEPLADVAEAHGLPLVEATDINDPGTVSEIASLDPDLCVCPGWSQILDESVLDVPTRGFVGFHASDLPRGRGGAPVNWSLIHGRDAVWLSLFYYTTGVDAGEVIEQRRVPIAPRDDVATVLDAVAVAARDIVDDARGPLAEGRVDATPQDLSRATYRPRRQPQDGLIDWSRPGDAVYDWVRAQTRPYPGAYTFLDGEWLTVWECEPVDVGASGPPGEVLAVTEGAGIDVATGDGRVRLARVQLDDEPAMWADTLAKRRGIAPGQRLSTDQAPPEWTYTGIRDASGGTRYATNLSPGETGTVTAVAVAPTESRRITVRATLDGDRLLEKTLTVEGRATVPIEYAPEQRGTHGLNVAFESDDRLDTRYLKVFVAD